MPDRFTSVAILQSTRLYASSRLSILPEVSQARLDAVHAYRLALPSSRPHRVSRHGWWRQGIGDDGHGV